MKQLISSGKFPLGPAVEVHFRAENAVIQHIDLSLSSTSGLKWCITDLKHNARVEAEIMHWLTYYVHKKPVAFTLPLNWNNLPTFTTQVLHELQKIPFAQFLSYKEIACLMKKPQAPRAVGQACGRNPFLLLVPCHRVLAANHALGGFSAGIEIKKRLLEFENIPHL